MLFRFQFMAACAVFALLGAHPLLAQTHYTDTVTTNLNVGDSISTTADGVQGSAPHGHGLYATNNKTLSAPGQNTITATGRVAHGLFADGIDGDATINATGATLTVSGFASYGATAYAHGAAATVTLSGGTITSYGDGGGGVSVTSQVSGFAANAELNSVTINLLSAGIGLDVEVFDGTATATVTDTTINAAAEQSAGIYLSNSSSLVSNNLVTIKGKTVVTMEGTGVFAVFIAGSTFIAEGSAFQFITNGADSKALRLYNGASATLGAGSLTTSNSNSQGVDMSAGAAATLTGTVITTNGPASAGLRMRDQDTNPGISGGGSTNTFTGTGVSITTHGAGSHGVEFVKTDAVTHTHNVTFDATSKIATTGAGSHIASVQQGIHETLSSTAGTGVLVLPSNGANISLTGADSAVAHVTDAGSLLTITDTGLPAGITLGTQQWGVLAENAGKAAFTTAATTQGYGLWAKGGTIEFHDTSTAANSRVRVDTGGVLDLTNSTLGNFPIASLEGNGGSVGLGANNLVIDGAAKTQYDGVIGSTGGGLTRAGTGTTILTGANTYTGPTNLNGGVLSVSADGNLGNGGALNFDGGTLQVTGTGFSSTPRTINWGAGGGGFDIANAANTFTVAQVLSGGPLKVNELGGLGTLKLTGADTFTATDVFNGALVVDTITSPITVHAAATLGGSGNSIINGQVDNFGTVVPGFGIPTPGSKLTINGNYVGHNGKLDIKTALGDDSSPTDQLVISGAGNQASGVTGIVVTNVGGAGAQTTANGIPIVVTTNGATSTAGAFKLDDPTAASAGAYRYNLFQGAPGAVGDDATSWFLRSQNDNGDTTHRPEVPMHSVFGAMVRQLGLLNLGTFHERNGDQRLADTGGRERGWARLFGQHMEQSHSGDVRPSFEGDFVGLQGGTDLWQFASLPGHRDNVGVFAAYTDGRAHVSGFALGVEKLVVGRVDIEATSVGAYWSHIAPSGWYTDAVVMGTLYDGDGRTVEASRLGVDGSGVIASLEGGFTLARFGGMKLEPQAQLVYQYVNLDADDPVAEVSHRTPDAFHGRIGLRLAADNWPWMLRPYLKANLWQDFAGSDRTIYNDLTEIVNRHRSTTLELGGGFTANIAPNVGLWASAGWSTDIGGTEQERESVSGTAGLRITW